jgi:large subunit ribosomal protein L21
MYAMINVVGDQLKVVAGEIITVNNLNKEIGELIENKEVMLIADADDVTIGTPYIESAMVKLEVIDNFKGKKVIAFKKRRRKSSKVKRGFRQHLTSLKVVEITK